MLVKHSPHSSMPVGTQVALYPWSVAAQAQALRCQLLRSQQRAAKPGIISILEPGSQITELLISSSITRAASHSSSTPAASYSHHGFSLFVHDFATPNIHPMIIYISLARDPCFTRAGKERGHHWSLFAQGYVIHTDVLRPETSVRDILSVLLSVGISVVSSFFFTS